MAHLFCELLLRLQLVGCADGNSFDLPLTQVELGDVLGLTNVHVNRVLQDLRKRNLIVLRGGTAGDPRSRGTPARVWLQPELPAPGTAPSDGVRPTLGARCGAMGGCGRIR
ncbi:helix-turn-helix domain-containing protein [Methylobacterium nigriterrae]|uniref:helix-turn-helix domain-containing protein n=1 Tax=Methylobacterium nigriterrae TaxID=3127512 RepID=UPI003013B152